MAKYRKKPVVVDAEQFFPDAQPLPFSPDPIVAFNGTDWYVTTIHGQETKIVAGDWIIREKGTSDKAYPCKPDIFEATYELA